MPRPRKSVESVEPVPPGPLSLVVRAGDPGYEKTVWGQKVYSYEIDQSDPGLVVIHAHLHPVAAEPAVVEPAAPVEPVVEEVL